MPLPHPVQHDILAAVRGVDVPRHVQPRAEAGDLAEEIGTAGAVDGAAVEVLFGGAVRGEDVEGFWGWGGWCCCCC